MIRDKTTCPKGHVYETIRPSNYTGKAQYPLSCPECRSKR